MIQMHLRLFVTSRPAIAMIQVMMSEGNTRFPALFPQMALTKQWHDSSLYSTTP
jgi:hypothetical protein